ncbi:MAG: metallophosphoesterase [Methylovulum sp.]|nr:metallophosphoesterase [Methylovulum sp.]
MSNKIKSLLIISAVAFSACASINLQADTKSTPFSIALIGDFPYSEEKLPEAQNLMEDLNAHTELSFIIHDGDFKGGSVPCDDKIYADRLATFNQSKHPLFFIFGDNEWTDCHRTAAGSYSPFERLALLRSQFANYSEQTSLGETKLPLKRQNEAFPENIRWSQDGVMFVGLHIPGSNNGLSTADLYLDQAKAEYKLRNAANLKWLRRSFAIATNANSAGIMVTIQANPWDFIPATGLTGFEDFLVALEEETRKFGKPVVLVHGDSHYFRIDKPLPSALPSEVINTDFPFIMTWDSAEPRLENFTRVETFGNPNTHWVKATIDKNDPNVFSFEQMIVEKNRSTAQ